MPFKRYHGPACDCTAHSPASPPVQQSTGWQAVLPLLACAFCPACLSMYAKVLSVFGVGIGLSDEYHRLLLSAAVAISVSLSARRSWTSKRVWPVLTAALGAGLILIGHLANELHAVEWFGVLVLLGGGWAEHFRLRRPPQSSLRAHHADVL